MELVGMMDSPYVRRVAISLKLLGLPFSHRSISLFREIEAFSAINPVLKAPTLVTTEGVVLIDSTLILDYLERLAPADRRLTPTDPAAFLRQQRLLGLALAATEKAVQVVYETNLRPADKQHQPWLDRVWSQLRAAYRLLESELTLTPAGWLLAERPLQADITTAVAWRFTGHALGTAFPPAEYPRLSQLSAQAEALPEFLSSPLE